VAGNEPVTSPDQRKPQNLKLARAGAVGSIVVLLAMLIGNHKGRIEDIWLIGLAALVALALIVDWVMRRNGLRS
jgi:hypothetical protein